MTRQSLIEKSWTKRGGKPKGPMRLNRENLGQREPPFRKMEGCTTTTTPPTTPAVLLGNPAI